MLWLVISYSTVNNTPIIKQNKVIYCPKGRKTTVAFTHNPCQQTTDKASPIKIKRFPNGRNYFKRVVSNKQHKSRKSEQWNRNTTKSAKTTHHQMGGRESKQKERIETVKKHSSISKLKERNGKTFSNGALDIGALEDDVVIGKAFLFLNEVFGVAILAGATVGSCGVETVGRELDSRDEEPLDQRERYCHQRARRNQNLNPDSWQERLIHGQTDPIFHKQTNKQRVSERVSDGFWRSKCQWEMRTKLLINIMGTNAMPYVSPCLRTYVPFQTKLSTY